MLGRGRDARRVDQAVADDARIVVDERREVLAAVADALGKQPTEVRRVLDDETERAAAIAQVVELLGEDRVVEIRATP